jgi:serine/threonine-protein kinase
VDEASLIGSTFAGRYRILELVGDGGMGQVFRAEQLSTGRTVALKLLHPEFSGVEEVVRRFEREAKVTTELSHPNIVKTVDFGESNGHLFLAMEFLPGRSLAQVIEHGHTGTGERLTVKRMMTVMRPILDALEYAHGRGVVHRDLKPENIMVIPARGLLARESIKLLDFGVAKLGVDAEAKGRKLTQLGMVLGTPGYMPPEQALGQKADARSDLYSCGVILYEMLTGRRPFESDSALEVMSMQLNAAPQSLQAMAPNMSIPAEVDGVVLRCLAKRPDDRFSSARELRAALEAAAAHARDGASGITTAKKTIAVAARALPRGGRLAIAAGAVALLLADHLAPTAAGSANQTTPLEASNSARATRSGARPDEPTPTRERNRPSSPALERESSGRTKHNPRHRRASLKRRPQ